MYRLFSLLLCSALVAPSLGRISELELRKERRGYIVVSSFGLLQGGSISVKWKNFKPHGHVKAVGFSIHRSSERATEYNMNIVDFQECYISADTEFNDNVMRMELNATSGESFDNLPWGYDDFVDDVVWRNQESLSGVSVEYFYGEEEQEYLISLKHKSAEDMYSIAIHYCNESPMLVGSYDMKLLVVELNPGPDFLGAGLKPIPNVYFFMAFFFAIASLMWAKVLLDAKGSSKLFKVHYLMLALVVVKTLSSLFHGVDYYFIGKEGARERGWAITYYCLHLAKGMILFLAILLIGVGYGFVKHALSKTERNVFLLVIPLQAFANIAGIVIEESAEGSAAASTWRSIGLLVDLICCGAILFPVVWSIRHLREASESDGKAKQSLTKLRVFRRFYVMVLAYIYTTRIIVYLIESTIPFRYEWSGPLFNEMTAFVFYFATGLMFAPEDDNEYLEVPLTTSDEEDFEMDEVVATNGFSDGLKSRSKAVASKPARPKTPTKSLAVSPNEPGAFEPDF